MTENARLEERPAWRDDVALELWVEVDRVPVLVRLVGTLDEATGPSLLSVLEDLLDQGAREFEFRTDGLAMVEPGGSASLEASRRLVERCGGRLRFPSE